MRNSLMASVAAVAVVGLCPSFVFGQRVSIAPVGSLTRDIDPGNDQNIELQVGESEIPSRMSLFPVDRGARDAWVSAKEKMKVSIGLEFALESTVMCCPQTGQANLNSLISQPKP